MKRSDSNSSSGGSNSNAHLCVEDLGYGDHRAGAPTGLYGSTLASLQYQPRAPIRGLAAYEKQDSERSTLGYGEGDDLSIMGECDVSSIRSDKNRPGRRASLSAAIELTRETPKRNTSGSRPRGRRNSMFGNNNKSAEELNGALPLEPEPTPHFFHKRKGGAPRRKGSADKDDPRTQHLTSQTRPGEKIKRPKNRRASMSAVPMGGKGVVAGHSSDEEDEDAVFSRIVPPRSSSYGNPRRAYQQAHHEPEVDEYGYEIDPQLPPPPPPSKRAMQNRRGSTGAFSSLGWNRGRRGSTASSVATSTVTDITDIASNRRHRPSLLQKRSDSPEPDLLGTSPQVTPQVTPQQGGKKAVDMKGFSMSPSENPTPVQSNRKIRDAMGASLSGTLGDSCGLLDAFDMDDSGDDQNDPKGRRSSTHAQRASLVQMDRSLGKKGAGAAGPAVGRGSVLGYNPYGNKALGHSESEESEDEDEDEIYGYNQQRQQSGDGKKEKELPPEEAPSSPKMGKTPVLDAQESSKKESEASGKLTADAIAATSGTVTTEDEDGEHSNGSMTSEAPQDAPKISDAENEGEMDAIEEIGATGDWSQGVQDYMYQTTQQTKKNSLLDRYPGSIDDNDILGYRDPMNAFDDESERKDEGDISDLYAEDYSSLSWRERQARAPESMEFINMEQLMSKAKNTKGLYLPTFIPAHGCTNASDFIVRCFVARLRAGITVTKHSRSRWCKSHDRILHILPTGYHITWIPETEEEAIKKSTKKPPTKLDLTKCLEVRHAWSRDPKARRYTGTATLRTKCKEGTANRSFALIYANRTVDFTAMTVDQCKILMEGFSALCFRLQMAKLEQQANDDDTHVTGMSGVEIDDDSTTASLTTTNMSAPWGL